MSFKDYLDDELMESKETNGDQTRYNCPFCPPNNDFKFYVNTSGSNKDGLWTCFKCGSKGNPVSFVMKYEKVDFNTAKDMLEIYGYGEDDFIHEASSKGLSVEEYLLLMMIEHDKPKEKDKEKELTPPPLPVGYKRIVDNLYNPEVIPFVDYLVNKRGYTTEDIVTHNIGYITDGYATTVTNNKVGIHNHVVFITHDNNGRYQYWNTRSIEPNPKIKSLNGMAKDNEFSKRTVIFNLNRAKNMNELVLVEGVTDALTVGDSGIATFGKQVTDEQVNLLLNNLLPTQKLYLMLDRDADEQTVKLADKLYPKHEETYIVLNPTGKDANDLGRDKTWEVIRAYAKKANPENLSLLFI